MKGCKRMKFMLQVQDYICNGVAMWFQFPDIVFLALVENLTIWRDVVAA